MCTTSGVVGELSWRGELAPVEPGERIETVDILRGFALFGIILVDMNAFLGRHSSADRTALWLIELFATNKFYPLFSLLFGVGFAIQVSRARARGAPFIPIYARRLGVLLGIGVMQQFFIMDRPILIRYALMGYPLMLFRHRSTRTILICAALSLVVASTAPGVTRHLVETRQAALLQGADAETVRALEGDETEARRERVRRARRIERTGSYTELVGLRWDKFVATFSGWNFYAAELANVFTMFLIGLYAVHRGIFDSTSAHLPFLRRVLWSGFAIGLVGRTLYVMLPVEEVAPPAGWILQRSLVLVGGFAVSLGYASAMLLLMAQSRRWRTRLGLLAWPGRMALTNYLMQWFLCASVFFGYGLGLYQKFGSAIGILFTLALFGAEIVWSRWWLGRFRFGPVEWLWRTLTYARFQPMRLAQSSGSSGPAAVV